MKRDDVILVRGGGDLATGTIHRLWSAGLKVLVLEAEHPAAIRRQVSVSEAVYEGGAVVEGMRAALVKTLDEAVVVWHRGDVPVMVDPKGAATVWAVSSGRVRPSPTQAYPESSAAMALSVSSTQKRPVSSGMCVPSEILCRRVKRSRRSKRRTASALR